MKTIFAFTLVVLAVILTSCSGDVASPTHNEYDSHAVTTTTTTETSNDQSMPQLLTGNKPECKGFIILNSCNTTQTGTQVSGQAAKAVLPKPPETVKQDEPITFGSVCEWFLIAIGIVFWFCVIIWVIGKVFDGSNGGY